MAPSKRLNLSSSRDEDESSSASSTESDSPARGSLPTAAADDESQTEDESDDEFEIPPGFESVKGSGDMTRESVLSADKELWFFKLPKHLDASALAGATFKVHNKASEPAGSVMAHVTAGEDHKPYVLQTEHEMLAGQLVNALPLAADRKRFVLAKPFARCFSLVEDHSSVMETATRPVDKLHTKSKKKTKKTKTHDEPAVEELPTTKKSKKSKKSKQQHLNHGEEPRAKKHKA